MQNDQEPKTLKIRIQTQTGKEFEIEMQQDSGNTIETLKSQIQRTQSIPVEWQHLSLKKDDKLQNEQKLQDFYWSNNNNDNNSKLKPSNSNPTLFFQLQIDVPTKSHDTIAPSGMNTKIKENEELKEETVKKNNISNSNLSFQHWKIQNGCNYGGTCKNEMCAAFQQPIMYHRGMGLIDPTTDEHLEENIICPACKQTFSIEGFYFFQCQVQVIFKKVGDSNLTKMPVKRIEGKDFWKFDENDQEKEKQFILLKFQVSKL